MAAPSRKKTRLVVFALALCTAGALFSAILLLQGQLNLFASAPAVHGAVDPANLTATATPFQPLPTDTPTPTATPTSTATPTPTETPTPTATHTPLPTDTPEPTTAFAAPEYPLPDDLPDSAQIEGVYGYAQAYTLTCESRSAVDWARFYGVDIGEMEFQAELPLSDNPDRGFVGYYNDPMGRVPPESYGVHAGPVADTLAQFGVGAAAVSGYDFNELRRQVAGGNPVIVWVIGNTWYGGTPIGYSSADGSSATVAHYEHTAIIVGYNEYSVTLVDGGQVYWRSNEAFLASWGVLNYMAVIKD